METREGVVVEASVVARLFGARLLAVDATVVVSPARVRTRPQALPPRLRSEPIGARLAAAERDIDDGAARLAASRV